MQKIITLGLVLVSLLTTYAVHTFIRKKIDPKRSFGHFIFYMLIHFLLVFLVVFAVSFLIFRFSNLMFKK